MPLSALQADWLQVAPAQISQQNRFGPWRFPPLYLFGTVQYDWRDTEVMIERQFMLYGPPSSLRICRLVGSGGGDDCGLNILD